MDQLPVQSRNAIPASAKIKNSHKMLPLLLGVELSSERSAGKQAQEKGVTIVLERNRLRALLLSLKLSHKRVCVAVRFVNDILESKTGASIVLPKAVAVVNVPGKPQFRQFS